MSKRKQLQPAAARNRPATKLPPSTLKQFLVKTWKAFFVIITVLVSLSGLLSFWPLISIEVGPQLDAGNSLSIPFIVSNDGSIPLFSVNVSCRFESVLFNDNTKLINSVAGPTKRMFLLAPHEKTTGPCHDQIYIVHPIKNGILTVEVSHYPFIWALKMTASRSFKTIITSDSKTVWLPQ